MIDVYESSVRPTRDFGAFFEFDGETAYFYLSQNPNEADGKVIGFIHIFSGNLNLSQDDVKVLWDITITKVGLFLFDKLWAFFDCENGKKYGGGYKFGCQPNIPEGIFTLPN